MNDSVCCVIVELMKAIMMMMFSDIGIRYGCSV